MRILIISKCPTHPTDAGNRWWILSQAEMFMSLGHDVYFLYVSEMPLRQNPKAYFESLELTKNIGEIDITCLLSVNCKNQDDFD